MRFPLRYYDVITFFLEEFPQSEMVTVCMWAFCMNMSSFKMFWWKLLVVKQKISENSDDFIKWIWRHCDVSDLRQIICANAPFDSRKHNSKSFLSFGDGIGDFHQRWYYDVITFFSRKNFLNWRWLLPACGLSAYTCHFSRRSDQNSGLWNKKCEKIGMTS